MASRTDAMIQHERAEVRFPHRYRGRLRRSGQSGPGLVRGGSHTTLGPVERTAYGVTMFCLTCDRLGVPRPVSVQNDFNFNNRVLCAGGNQWWRVGCTRSIFP